MTSEERRAYNRAYHQANKEAIREKARLWNEAHAEDRRVYMREYAKAHPEKWRTNGAAYRAAVREQFMAAYGGKCACCGEAEDRFLTIDHVDGYRHDSGEPRGGTPLYRLALEQGCPSRFQILCYNCNCSKGNYGVCPHQQQGAAQK